MIWFIGIMIVVIALIVGPVMMLRPTPEQKNREALRAIAAAKGIRFTIKKLPQQATEMESPAPTSVYFFAPVNHQESDDWLLLRATYSHEILYLRGWEWQGDVRPPAAEQEVLKKYLPLMSDDVRAVSAGSQGICVYWHEKGGEAALAPVIGLLEALRQLQVAEPSAPVTSLE